MSAQEIARDVIGQMSNEDFKAFAKAKSDKARRKVVLAALARNTARLNAIMSDAKQWNAAVSVLRTAYWVAAQVDTDANRR